MSYQRICAILQVLCFGIAIVVVRCQNAPSLDWQFDPYSTDQWFKQKQDHYDAGNIQYWPQRYVTTYRFFRLGGPIFLYLSGPGPELTIDDIESGAIAAYAEEQGAFVIGLEHRYYGKSRPTQDLSKDNLKYLTIPQTIEDIAAFIRSWRTRDEFTHSKWVVFGASYLGSISAWFAQKHPELIDAFVASSAPLELRYEIPEFLQTVGSILNQTDPKCYENVAEGFSCLENIVNEQGCESYSLNDAKDKFEFCADLDSNSALDTTGVFAELFSTVNAVVMYHDPDPKSFPDTDLQKFCTHMTSDKGGKSSFEKLGEKVKEINKHRGLPCSEFRFQTTVDFLKDQDWDSDAAKEGYRQLQWQLCNELGWTVASANISQPFGHYLSPFLHSEICQKLFGLTETEMRLKVLQANTDLKGKDLVTKCGIYVNGDHDPWHTFGITNADEAGKCNRAVFIEGGSHGRDVEEYSSTPSYPPQLRDAQQKIAAYLDSWLKTGKCCEEYGQDESRKIRGTYSRSPRNPGPYSFPNEFLKPNVQIKPHAYPPGLGDKLIASPTSIPYQVSTTDILSVSPRIPIAGQRQDLDEEGGDMYRDPRNSEFRRYRIVKFLKHRLPNAPMSYERGGPPSIEQFEADFPEHSIRVEGRVERVFKNGSRMIPSADPSGYTQIPSPRPQTDGQRYDWSHRVQMPTVAPMNRPPGPTPTMQAQDGAGTGKPFRFVVKQVFKHYVGDEGGDNNNRETYVEEPPKRADIQGERTSVSTEISGNAQNQGPAKNSGIMEGEKSKKPFWEEYDDNYSSSSSLSEEDRKSPMKGVSPKESNVRKRDSNENDGNSTDSSESSSSISSSMEGSDEDMPATTAKPGKMSSGNKGKSEETPVRVSSKSKESKPTSDSNELDGKEDYEDDSYYYDDYYDDHVDSRGRARSKDRGKDDDREGAVKPTRQSTSRGGATGSKTTKSSTEFTSGESTKPRRLREKISEKIMSSSEDVTGNQKSREDPPSKSNSRGKKNNGRNKNGSDEQDDSDRSSSSSSSSSSEERSPLDDDDYDNFSLEPSGSNPKKVYKKKQLSPLVSPIDEEPSTVINVEISGSYPKVTRRRKKVRRTTTTEEPTTDFPSENHSQEETPVSDETETTTTPKPRRRVHRRRRPNQRRRRPENLEEVTTTLAPYYTTTESTIEAATSESTTTMAVMPPSPFETTPGPYSNSYVDWNRRKLPIPAKPVQTESPSFVNLENNRDPNTPPDSDVTQSKSPKNNDVVYIIIGDVPKEDRENMIFDESSGDALFNFIQQLVGRHSGVFSPSERPSSFSPPSQPASTPPPPNYPPPRPPQVSTPPPNYLPPPPPQWESTSRPNYLPPPPPPPPPPTTTPSPPRALPISYGDEHKYLLVRPVQVVSLGREHVVHAHDLKNDSLIDLMTSEDPRRSHAYPNAPSYQTQGRKNMYPEHPSYQQQPPGFKRQNFNGGGGYSFKSPFHRDHFERLLSVDGQIRDSDREHGLGYQSGGGRRLDQIPDPSWRSIRGVSQFGPVSSHSGGLLSLSSADTRWVNEGVPFIPRNSRQMRNEQRFDSNIN